MSYTVLARKWRPKNFTELVGQSHVIQALSNALDQQRLHHAYLFTGTRGVGKTTIARIFAKALNCEQGITSNPCGSCSNCTSIAEGRFVDLIEVDAASKTKVDDTRELLDNVQYTAVQGRYKVYLIDEVHMLSKSSFNALLKTLEEPPEHVKFLLATTDPHKLPMTVLSRCLQFNLMRLTVTQIQNHLAYILQQEGVPFEESALALIAKSADGSARDGLSILDQAIAYGAGKVDFHPVQTMLGLVDQQFTALLLQALVQESAEQLKTVLQQLASMGVDYVALLSQLIEVLHQIALIQVLGEIGEVAVLEEKLLQDIAVQLSPERTQMLYQIALLGRQDMSLAPDERIGFEMAMLRMLAFVPASSANIPQQQSQIVNSTGVVKTSISQVSMVPATAVDNEYSLQTNPVEMLKKNFANRENRENRENRQNRQNGQTSNSDAEKKIKSVVSNTTEKTHLESLQSRLKETLGKSRDSVDVTPKAIKDKIIPKLEKVSSVETLQEGNKLVSDSVKLVETNEDELKVPAILNDRESLSVKIWIDLIKKIKPEAMAEELANQSVLLIQETNRIVLSVDSAQAIAKTDLAVQRLQESIHLQLGAEVFLEFVEFKGEFLTPAKYKQNQMKTVQQEASQSIHDDSVVGELTSVLHLRVIESSIKPN